MALSSNHRSSKHSSYFHKHILSSNIHNVETTSPYGDRNIFRQGTGLTRQSTADLSIVHDYIKSDSSEFYRENNKPSCSNSANFLKNVKETLTIEQKHEKAIHGTSSLDSEEIPTFIIAVSPEEIAQNNYNRREMSSVSDEDLPRFKRLVHVSSTSSAGLKQRNSYGRSSKVIVGTIGAPGISKNLNHTNFTRNSFAGLQQTSTSSLSKSPQTDMRKETLTCTSSTPMKGFKSGNAFSRSISIHSSGERVVIKPQGEENDHNYKGHDLQLSKDLLSRIDANETMPRYRSNSDNSSLRRQQLRGITSSTALEGCSCTNLDSFRSTYSSPRTSLHIPDQITTLNRTKSIQGNGVNKGHHKQTPSVPDGSVDTSPSSSNDINIFVKGERFPKPTHKLLSNVNGSSNRSFIRQGDGIIRPIYTDPAGTISTSTTFRDSNCTLNHRKSGHSPLSSSTPQSFIRHSKPTTDGDVRPNNTRSKGMFKWPGSRISTKSNGSKPNNAGKVLASKRLSQVRRNYVSVGDDKKVTVDIPFDLSEFKFNPTSCIKELTMGDTQAKVFVSIVESINGFLQLIAKRVIKINSSKNVHSLKNLLRSCRLAKRYSKQCEKINTFVTIVMEDQCMAPTFGLEISFHKVTKTPTIAYSCVPIPQLYIDITRREERVQF